MPSRVPRNRDEDPLSQAIAPPPNETPAQRDARVQAEREAKRISDAIDDEINKERIAAKKAPKPVKILLLGQSESGKSTTLKNFQLLASPKAFNVERASWRTVIQLNVVRSIRLVLDLMGDSPRTTPPQTPPKTTPSPPPDSRSHPDITLSPELRLLKMRLSPLAQVEEALILKLNPSGRLQFEGTELSGPTPDTGTKEFALNSTAWRGAIGRLLGNRQSIEGPIDFDDPKDPGALINACGPDMIALWNDPAVQRLLAKKKLRIEETSGFFLDALDRVTQLRYVPTNEDILKARIKTLGVTEYRFKMACAGHTLSHDWRVFDVGGQRSLRAAWVPYMDDVDAIIFLAPISCFDQVLAEDPKVNRLEDSVLLWKAVISNPLLQKTDLVLFLNKCDILKAKLASGVRLADYVVSYGDRPNDFESASHYLKKKFVAIYRQHSKECRAVYPHFTSVTDNESTKLILGNVQDTLITENLKNSQLIV